MVDKVIVQVLGFLGSLREYSYIDRLGNIIDEIAFKEAIRDAIRSYYALCLDKTGKEKCVEYEKGIGVECFDISKDELEKEISQILDKLSKSTRIEIIESSREMALKAYAAIPKIRGERMCTK